VIASIIVCKTKRIHNESKDKQLGLFKCEGISIPATLTNQEYLFMKDLSKSNPRETRKVVNYT